MADSKVADLPRLSPPFIGSELVYVVGADGLDYKVLMSDLQAVSQQTVVNADVVPIPAGSAVYLSAAGHVKLASNALDIASAAAFGIALEAIAVGAQGQISTGGPVTGLSGLTVGYVFLGVAGGLVFVPNLTEGQFNVPLGRAISSTVMLWSPQYPIAQ